MSDRTKDVLEQNVETLLETGGEPPRITRHRARADPRRARRKHGVAHGADARAYAACSRSALGLAATAAAVADRHALSSGRDPTEHDR